MRSGGERRIGRALTAWAAALLAPLVGAAGGVSVLAAAATPALAASPPLSGGAPIGGLAPTGKPRTSIPAPPGKHAHGSWLQGVTITEYWPAPEAWFVGAPVTAPGLSGRHRIDWLYSAMGVSMQGEGVGLDGRMYHLNAPGDAGWVTVGGLSTTPFDGWAAGPPYWRAGGYWTNRTGAVTFPLARGGWSAGRGHRYISLPGITFAPGASLPLRFYQSIAVDPGVIPLGSRVYIPAYRRDGHGGWFVAQDTGGAVNGAHVDVYRSPPASADDSGQYLTRQRIFVIEPQR
jgi:3D (Asp-Asp-Asp) domain-containing protein